MGLFFLSNVLIMYHFLWLEDLEGVSFFFFNLSILMDKLFLCSCFVGQYKKWTLLYIPRKSVVGSRPSPLYLVAWSTLDPMTQVSVPDDEIEVAHLKDCSLNWEVKFNLYPFVWFYATHFHRMHCMCCYYGVMATD